MSRLVVVSDAWHPQVNGVVRTLDSLSAELTGLGVETTVLSPAGLPAIPCPTYPSIPLALTTPASVGRKIEAAAADYVHIATEGPLGWAARHWCLRHHRRFTTSYHTRFPEYVSARLPLPASWVYAVLRHFHNAGSGCMVATASLQRELAGEGFRNLMRWSRGVNFGLFRPRPGVDVLRLPRPIFLSVGRVAVEKNLRAFLDLDLPGSKVVVGDGPQQGELKAAYSQAHFLGTRQGEALARTYASADVFVFPSRTDTFGVVLLEAMASGVPVAALPVPGPLDVVGSSGGGVLDEDLRLACLAALSLRRDRCREVGLQQSWRRSAEQFLGNLIAANNERRKAA